MERGSDPFNLSRNKNVNILYMSCAPNDECYLTGVNDGYAAALKRHRITEEDEDDEDYEGKEETERIRLKEEEEEKRIRLDKKAAAITAQKQKVAARNAQTQNYENSEQIKREGKGLAMPGPFRYGGRSKRNPNATKKRKAKITKKRSKSAKKRK